ncbi:tip elongation aberrant protein 1 isoform X3 [Esox lucius]|uniref:tip elongation aberrant protein 1 isoform X3 n=1 Tax=Esox lucius TaxID=8010 RepID=UPI0009731C72|nr:tip elongation aberrant protein 1 isoform X3 [Esox lucius]
MQTTTLATTFNVFSQPFTYRVWTMLYGSLSHDSPLRAITKELIKSNRKFHQVHVPLPLPKQVVVFSLGEWKFLSSETTISIDVLVSQDVKPQRIGTLSALTRCLTWEGDWNADLVKEATEKGRRGVYGKILLTVCGENEASFISNIPLVPRKCSSPVDHNNSHLSQTQLNNTGIQMVNDKITTLNSSQLKNSICYAELKTETTEINDSNLSEKPSVWPTDKTPRQTVIGKRGHFAWSPEHCDTTQEETGQASCSKRICPSKRWSHSMVLSDPETAIVIGGEASEQTPCLDSLWKLEIDNDFWFQMNSLTSGTGPLCACGHSATYDSESKALYVYGGLREGQRYSELYILNTLTWKWKLVTAKGDVPMLAYHSATIYNKELFVFGGVHPSHCHGGKTCSNALYIFNPEFELWYQPIIEGARPLPKFGHTTTLLSNQLLIFGGRTTASYLNDLHILDLGFMEYTAVKYENMPPLPRGYHAALPVSHNRMMISGGCSAIGALQDIHIFNVDTSMWSSVVSPLLWTKPRAGHSMIHLEGSVLSSADKQKQGEDANTHYTLLVFGGCDCAGTFYNDTVKCTLEIPDEKRGP